MGALDLTTTMRHFHLAGITSQRYKKRYFLGSVSTPTYFIILLDNSVF